MTVRDDWLNRYHGKSKKQALVSLNAFDRFVLNYKDKTFTEDLLIVALKDEGNRYFILDDMVQYWNSVEMSPATIRNYFTFIRSYLSRHHISTDLQQVKYHVRFPKRIKEARNAIDKQIICKIISVSDPRYQALILFLLSSGMRIGEALDCRIGWLDFRFLQTHQVVLIKIPANVTKGKSDRITFITMQAYEAIKPYLKSKLRITDHVFDMSYSASEEYVSWIREKISYDERYVSGVHKLTIHSFRSVTRTYLSDNTTSEFAYFLLGQDGYLPTYYRKTPEEAVTLYVKAAPYLTITDHIEFQSI